MRSREPPVDLVDVHGFIALPTLLALVGARLLDRRVGDAVLGTVAAGALGALTWFLTILWLASQGVFE